MVKLVPLPGSRFGEDEAARLLDDAVDGGKAEPGPLPHFLGGEEGLEDLAERCGGMPVPVSVTLSAV